MAISADIRVIAIGASAGGLDALQKLLTELPKDFEIPILVVQHISPGFLRYVAQWLGNATGKQLKIAVDREQVHPKTVYFAPDGFHMGIGDDRRITLSDEGPEYGSRPSVSYLFRSVARVFGRDAAGILLSGMGRDGAEELRAMKASGAVTIVQDKEGCVVHGMPGAAIKLGAAMHVLQPEEIAMLLSSLAKGEKTVQIRQKTGDAENLKDFFQDTVT